MKYEINSLRYLWDVNSKYFFYNGDLYVKVENCENFKKYDSSIYCVNIGDGALYLIDEDARVIEIYDLMLKCSKYQDVDYYCKLCKKFYGSAIDK